MRWSCFGRTVEKGGTIRMFCEEEIAHLLSKNMERTERIHFDRCHRVLNRRRHPAIDRRLLWDL